MRLNRLESDLYWYMQSSSKHFENFTRRVPTSPYDSLNNREVSPRFSTEQMLCGTLSDPNILSRNFFSYGLREVSGKRLGQVIVVERLPMWTLCTDLSEQIELPFG